MHESSAVLPDAGEDDCWPDHLAAIQLPCAVEEQLWLGDLPQQDAMLATREETVLLCVHQKAPSSQAGRAPTRWKSGGDLLAIRRLCLQRSAGSS